MNEQRTSDEALLIDYLRGECDEQAAEEVRSRLESDERLRGMRRDLTHAFAALDAAPDYDPPEDLVRRTMWRIAARKRTDALLDREQERPRIYSPTFSLREAIALGAAILVLAVILVPSLRQAGRIRTAQLCESQIGRIGAGFQTYANENNGYLPVAAASAARWLPDGDEPAVSNSQGLFRLILGGHAEPDLFQCPAMEREPLTVKAGMHDFPAGRFVDYSYQYAIGPSAPRMDHPDLSRFADRMAILADGSPVFAHGRFRPNCPRDANSENHGGDGQNVLYLDMHAGWAPTPTAGVHEDNIYLADGVDRYIGVETPAAPHDTFLLPSYSGRE